MVQRVNLKDIDISLESEDSSLVRGRITGAEGLSFTLSADDTVAFEAGSYLPVEIIDGKVSISGSLTRAWINNDFFRALFPVVETGSFKSVLKPSFTLSGKIYNGKSPDRRIILYGVKFNSVNVQNLSVDSYATQNLPFNATGYRILA